MVLVSLTAGVGEAPAQVVLDGKFGTAGPLNGPNYSVPADLGSTHGNNLFHSFSQFDLVKGDIASFTGPANIQNILARVTGGSPSSIDGTIRSEIAGANFFFINPSGIIFGPNASVDVSGSFAASTANYLKLADGARFAAALDADDSTLSTAPVAAFGFLGNAPGNVSVEQSTLAVGETKGLSIVGGDIRVDQGVLRAPGGQLTVVSAAAGSEVPVSGEVIPGGGAIELKNNSHFDGNGENGARVVIRGGKLTVDSSKIEANSLGSGAGQGIDIAVADSIQLSNGGQINSLSPSGLGAGGDINIKAKSLLMDGGGLIDESFNPTTQISAATGDLFFGGGPAKGGDIKIQVDQVQLVNSAQISSATSGAGDAGRIEIEAKSLSLDAQLITPTQITANTQQFEGGGKAGDIVIRADSFELLNGATLLAASFGSAPAGLIDINARSANILSGGIITAGTFGSGLGGNVQVTADSLRLDGRDRLGGGPDLLTGIQAVTTSGDAPAPGGTIRIKADSLEIANAGSIFTSSFGLGPGGNVEVVTGSLTLNNAGSIRAAGEAVGAAGNIAINASGPINLANQSSVNTSAPGSSGGDIRIRGEADVHLSQSEINAQAGLDGGNVSLGSPALIYLKDSKVSGQADTTGSGFGNGGNLTLEPSILVLNNASLISKSSFGNGGNISILSDYFFPSRGVIDASAPFGLPGTVQVTAPEVDLSGVLAVLVGNFLDAATLLRPDCGVRLGGNISSFIVMGRGGLPLSPGGFVPSSTVEETNESK